MSERTLAMINKLALVDPRLDEVTLEAPQGGYFANSCLKQVSNDNDHFYNPADRADPGVVAQTLMDGGIEFESLVGEALKEIFAGDPEVVFIPSCDRSDKSKKKRERATIAAMKSGARFIWNARLPRFGDRISEPDWLERLGDAPKANGKWAYAPGDVKHARAIHPTTSERVWYSADFNREGFASATAAFRATGYPQLKHSLQLAHYFRHLQDLGFATEESKVWGAIYAKEGTRIYRDLNEPIYLHLDRSSSSRTRMSALEVYDQEFALRILIAKAATLRDDPETAPPVGPEVCGPSCDCPWRVVSEEELEERDSIILLQGITFGIAQPLLELGITKRSQLARLDWKTARLLDSDINVHALINLAKSEPAKTKIEKILVSEVVDGKADHVIAREVAKATEVMAAIKVKTTGDLLEMLDSKTLALAGAKVNRLADHIDQARCTKANAGKGRVVRRRGFTHVAVPAGAVQLDIDMENDDHIYLWGVRANIKTRGVERSEYRAFVSWDRTDEGEAKAFSEFWQYLVAVRKWAKDGHIGSFNAYHWSEAEDRCMKALAKKHAGYPGIPSMEELEAFLTSSEWVDLYTILKEQTIWPTPDLSVKSVAKYLKFFWRDEQASGGASVNWYREATLADEEDVRSLAQTRLLEYNEDDVKATFEIRKWLHSLSVGRRAGVKLPSVEDLESSFRPRRVTPGVTAAQVDLVTPIKKRAVSKTVAKATQSYMKVKA